MEKDKKIIIEIGDNLKHILYVALENNTEDIRTSFVIKEVCEGLALLLKEQKK